MAATTAGSAARARLRAMIAKRVTGKKSVKCPEIAREVTNEIFVNKDTEIIEAVLYDAIYEHVRLAFQKTRNYFVTEDGTAIPKGAPDAADAVFARTWDNWWVHTVKDMVILPTMTKAQLRAASAERRKRVDTELRIIRLLDAIADKLDDTQQVRDVFSEQDIEDLDIQINGQPGTGTGKDN